MTEAEWLASDDPEAMHSVVAKGAFQTGYNHNQRTQRKRDLFSAACCRLVWPWVDTFRVPTSEPRTNPRTS